MATADELKTRVTRGIAWVGVASSLVALLDAVALFLILARWVSKGEYGTVALVTWMFPVLDLATDLGMAAAVIQADDHTPEKISTVFWLNLVMSLVLVTLLGVGVGPLLSWIYGEPILTWLLLAYGGKLIWQNVYFIPYALMKREFRFKELSILRVVANLAEFAGKVGTAWAGFGIWCFVIGPLCRVAVTGIGIQLMHPWRPRFVLRWREAIEWTRFGLRTSAHRILFYTYTNVDYLVVGKVFGKDANGIYKTAYDLVLTPALVISEVITQVAFPVFARMKHSRDQLAAQFVAFVRMNLVLMMAFVGVIFLSADLVFDLLQRGQHEDWSAGVPAARILCFVALLRTLSFVVPPLLDGMGKPNLTLRYTAVAAIVVPACFVGFAHLLRDQLGFLSVAVGWAVGYPIAFAFLFAMALAVLDLRAGVFLRQIAGTPLCAAIALAVAEAVALALAHAAMPVRALVAAAVFVIVFFGLIAKFQGITPRAIRRALRGEKPPGQPATGSASAP